MKDRTRRQFLELIRSGLSGKEARISVFAEGVDWKALHRLATEQTLVGVVTDGIDLLKGPLRPFDEAMDPFLGDLMTTEQRNERMDSFAVKLVRRLEKEGMTPLVLKGQPLAREYRNPSHRQCGDIDLLLTPDEYGRAKDILVPKATKVETEYDEILHQGLYFGPLAVELHGAVSTLMSPSLDESLSACTSRMFSERKFRSVGIKDCEVKVPPLWFDAMYIFVHMLHHYWSSGVALRQILDWSLFVTNHYDEFDMQRLDRVVTELGVKHMWQVFAGFAAETFDLPEDRFPFYVKTWKGKNRRILRFVLRSGNFGRKEDRTRDEDEGFLKKKLLSFWMNVVHDRLRHFPTFPKESMRYFSGAFRYGMSRLSKGD